MPVTTTVSERILREFVNRLEAYQGVNFTVYREMNDVEKMTPTDYQVVVKTSANTRQPTLDRIGNPPVIAYDIIVTCYGQLLISETDADPIEAHGYEVAAHIVKAITTGASWYTFDGNAINASVQDIVTTGSTGYRSGEVAFRVTYRFNENDPFTAAI